MRTILVESPTDFTPFELAEWVEVTMTLNEWTSLSRTAISRMFPAGQGPDGAELDQLFAEVRQRAMIAPTTYPYRDQEESIVIADDVDPRIYQFLLILCIEYAPYRTENRYNQVNPCFELLTREALLATMGPGAQGLRFGWPVGDGRPEHLADAVAWLADQMGLATGNYEDEIDIHDKDGGIDVVGWLPFADRAPSFPVYLVQCTVQSTYERKTSDVTPKKWASWINFGMEPQVALSVPFAIPSEAKVRVVKLKYSVNLLLDRLRIIQLLENRGTLVEYDEYEAMRSWTATELVRTRDSIADPTARTPKLQRTRKPVRIVRKSLQPNPSDG